MRSGKRERWPGGIYCRRCLERMGGRCLFMGWDVGRMISDANNEGPGLSDDES